MVGSLIGPYRVLRLLGEGGMGAVYEGLNESIERRVAIKVLHADSARQPEIVARFFNEARAANRIAHPSIVQIHEHGQLPNGPAYIVMEYLEGQTLGERLRQTGGRLPLRTALQFAWQVAAALAAAHGKQIVHRDLKPGNLMLVPDPLGPVGERVKVLDFGIAKLVADTQQSKTASQLIMGTPTYMSPEQGKGAGMVDEKTDTYSLGVILFQMLAGRPPFDGGPGEVIAKHMFQAPPPLSYFAPDVPADIADFVNLLLSKDKLQRPSMRDVFQRLSDWATSYAGVSMSAAHEVTKFVALPPARDSDATAFHSEHSTIESRGQRQAGGRRRPGALLIVGSLAAAAGLAIWMYSARTEQRAPIPSSTPTKQTAVSRAPTAPKDVPSDSSTAERLRPVKTWSQDGSRPTPSVQFQKRQNSPKVGANPFDVNHKLEEAQAEYVNGNYSKTIEIARPIAGRSPLRAWRIIGSAACNIKDLRLASDAYRQLDLTGRKYLLSVCQRNGILNLGEPDQSVRIVE